MILFEAYLSLMLMMTPIDESWNYMNPHPFEKLYYYELEKRRFLFLY